MSTIAFRWRLAAMLFMLALPACDDSTAPPASISVELSSSALGVTQGRTASVFVWVFSDESDGPIQLAVAGAPAGVAVQFEPGLIQTGRGSKLTVTAAPYAVPGTYSLTITGSGSGVTAVSTMLVLNIAQAPPPELALYAGAPSLSVGRGQDNWIPVTVARDNYEGAVELALHGVPAGVTAAFDHTVLPYGTSVTLLRVHASPAAALGKHTLTIATSGEGLPGKTVKLDLTVTDALPTVMFVQVDLDGAVCALAAWFEPLVTVTRLSGFNGPIELTFEGLPPGLTGTLDVAEVGGGISGWLHLNMDAEIDGSAYALIRAKSPGVADATAVFKVCGGRVL